MAGPVPPHAPQTEPGEIGPSGPGIQGVPRRADDYPRDDEYGHIPEHGPALTTIAPSLKIMIDARAAGHEWDDIHDAIAQQGGHDAINQQVAGDVTPLRPGSSQVPFGIPGDTGEILDRMHQQGITGYSTPNPPVTFPDGNPAAPANEANFQDRMSYRIQQQMAT